MKRISLSFLFFAIPFFAFASNIDATNKYTRFLSTNALINFGTNNGNVVVTNSAVASYSWSETKGWIVFNCATDSSCGTLSHKVQTTRVPSATVVTPTKQNCSPY